MHLFSDRGTPRSLRHTDAFSGHTYKFTTTEGKFHYVKIHFKTDQGIKNFTAAEAAKMAGENPDYNTQDLFESIEKGDSPTWTAYLQVMTPEQAEGYRWNIFDMTKVWPHADFPLIPFGKLELNRNVSPLTLTAKHRPKLTQSSPKTTSPTSNKQPSPPQQWSQE